MENTVFAKARPEDVRSDPFPHLVIEDALDADLFQALLRTRPPYNGGADADNRRTAIPAWVIMTTEVFDPAWQDFATLHTRPEITRHVLDLFAGHLADSQPDLSETTRFGVQGIDDWQTADVLCDARLEIISQARTGGSHRMGHLDAPNRLFSALLYLRAAGDTSTGGGLDLFRWTEGPKGQLDSFELPQSDIERVDTVPYKANTLVVFPNSADALHGSQTRPPTGHDRAYVFITAEIETDLF
ncbi:MAG: 2OG-Fe(II) oxygenase [Rhodospirillales bacterium]|nr:2OG-Fe(II) oxygenase [Rhodospirillales bacterium]